MTVHDVFTMPDHRQRRRRLTGARTAPGSRAQAEGNRRPPRAGRAPSPKQAQAGAASKPVRVLICDDSVHARTTLARALKAQDGIDVADLAESFEEAAERMRAGEVDVLLLDVFLPGKTGLEGLVALREAGDATPVVLMSADGDFDTQGRSLGAVSFFDKTTADFATLAALLRQAGTARRGGP